MISPESRSREWITAKHNQYPNIGNPALIEKAIRAFSLLESLVRSDLPFIFKGGTALMLHLDSPRRLSIDVDIVCPPGTDIHKHLGKYAGEYGFTDVNEIERIKRTNVPKSHAEYKYAVSYPSGYPNDHILLDVLYEDIKYAEVVLLPITSPFLKTEGETALVRCPSLSDMLGDKLTAFAPHTTGIPFFKGTNPCFMEVMKQLFDTSSILDRVDNLSITRDTYRQLVPIELGYRNLDHLSEADVLDDTYQTALNICLRGALSKREYEYLTNGANRINEFIITENYSMERAVRDASKVAYLVRMLQTGNNEVQHFHPKMSEQLAGQTIVAPQINKLNRIKKLSPEAFFYWRRIEELL